MRKIIAASLVIVSLGLFTYAAALDVNLGNMTKKETADFCKSIGATKSWENPEGTNWGCSKKCGEKGSCGVMCDKDTGCLGSTPQARAVVPPDEREGAVRDIFMYSPKSKADTPVQSR